MHPTTTEPENPEQAKITETFTALRQAVVDVTDAFWSYLSERLPGILAAAENLYGTFWQAYLSAGAPYGETSDGMMRWMSDLAKITRLEDETEHLRQHHAMLAHFRRQLAERKGGPVA